MNVYVRRDNRGTFTEQLCPLMRVTLTDYLIHVLIQAMIANAGYG